MSLLFALAALVTTGPEAETLSADEQGQVSEMTDQAREITALARKLRAVRIAVDVRYGEGRAELRSCRVTTSGGDAEIDAIPCAVTQECAARNPANQRELAACTRDLGDMRVMALFEARAVGGDGKP